MPGQVGRCRSPAGITRPGPVEVAPVPGQRGQPGPLLVGTVMIQADGAAGRAQGRVSPAQGSAHRPQPGATHRAPRIVHHLHPRRPVAVGTRSSARALTPSGAAGKLPRTRRASGVDQADLARGQGGPVRAGREHGPDCDQGFFVIVHADIQVGVRRQAVAEDARRNQGRVEPAANVFGGGGGGWAGRDPGGGREGWQGQGGGTLALAGQIGGLQCPQRGAGHGCGAPGRIQPGKPGQGCDRGPAAAAARRAGSRCMAPAAQPRLPGRRGPGRGRRARARPELPGRTLRSPRPPPGRGVPRPGRRPARRRVRRSGSPRPRGRWVVLPA